MFSHQEILDKLARDQRRNRAPTQDQRLFRRYRSQLALMNSSSTCSERLLFQWNARLANLDPELLRITSQQQFYNGALMQTIGCMVDSLSLSGSALTYNFRIRDYIHKLQRIGAESVQGIAMKADFENAVGTFVIKVSRDVDNPEIYHEAFTALFGTNQLRVLVPNFAYVFGIMRCSAPAFGSSSKVITWCNNIRSNTAYLLYENINPSISFRKLAQTGSLSDFLNGYLQVVYALNLAQSEIDFTHNDLHDDNVLWREIPGQPSMSIPYQTENGLEYLNTSRISTIIDFGFAHLKLNQTHYGPIGLEAYGAFEDSSHSFYDAYKLLMFMLYSRREAGLKDYRRFEPLIKILFGSTPLDQILDEQRETLFALPEIVYPVSSGQVQTTRLNPLIWAKVIREMFPNETDFFSSSPQGHLVSCESGQCLDSKQILERIGLAGVPKADDVNQYFDLMTQIYLTEEIKSRIKSNFNKSAALKSAQTQAKRLAQQAQELLQDFVQVQLPTDQGRVNLIWSQGFLDLYQKYAIDIAKAYELFAELSVLQRSMSFVDSRSFSENRTLDQLSTLIRRERNKLRSDIEMIQELYQRNSARLKKLSKINPDLKWYKVSLPLYLQMLDTPV